MKGPRPFAAVGTALLPAMVWAEATSPDYYVEAYVDGAKFQLECKTRTPGSSEPKNCRFVPIPGAEIRLVAANPGAPAGAASPQPGTPPPEGSSGTAGTDGNTSGNGSDTKPPAPKTAEKNTKIAADKPKTAFEAVSSLLQSDITIPASPAFAVLGIKPENVQRPNTVRALAGSLVRGLGTDGKMVNGIAVDMSPASLFFRSVIVGGTSYMPRAPEGLNEAESSKYYHNDLSLSNYWKRLLARTTVSLATTSADANGTSRAAFGLRMGLVDFGDPGLYADVVDRCVREKLGPVMKSEPSIDDNSKDTLSSAISSCNVAKNEVYGLWAAPSLYLGLGKSWYSGDTSILNSSPDAKALWLGGSWGPGFWNRDGKAPSSEMRWLLQLYAGRRINDRAEDPNNAGQLIRQDATEGTFRIRLGHPTWHGFFDIGHSRVRLGNATNESLRHLAIGVEFKLDFLEDSWLQLASVRETGFSNGKDKNGATMNFKIGAPFLQAPGLGSR